MALTKIITRLEIGKLLLQIVIYFSININERCERLRESNMQRLIIMIPDLLLID